MGKTRVGVDARVLQPVTTGIARPLRAILKLWSTKNSPVELVVYIPWKEDLGDSEIGECAEVVELRTRSRLRWYYRLRHSLVRDRVDHAFFPIFSTMVQTVPYTIVVHDLNFLRYHNSILGIRDLAYRLVTPRIVHGARHVIVPSSATLRDAERYYGPGPYSVIPPGLDFPEFHVLATSEARSVVDSLGVESSKPFLLHVGRVSPPFKNLYRLMKAFQLAKRDDYVPPVFVIATRDRLPANCEQILSQNPEAFRVLHGLPDRALSALYNLCVAFVYPSLAEGFGSPLLEAMNCGAPILTSDLSAMPETVADAGVLFDPTSVEDMAAAIVRVCGDKTLRDEMRSKSLARAAQLGTSRYAREVLQVILDTAIPSTG